MSGTEKLSEQNPDTPDSGVTSSSEGLIISVRSQVENLQKDVAEVRADILGTILQRLKKPAHFKRPNVNIDEVHDVLLANQAVLDLLYCMDLTGGHPDIVSLANHSFLFADCSSESPAKRRGLDLCGVTDAVEKSGVQLLSKEIYTKMQKMGVFDEETSSILDTPDEMIRSGLMLVGFRGNKGASFMNPGIENKRDDRGWRGMVSVSRKKNK